MQAAPGANLLMMRFCGRLFELYNHVYIRRRIERFQIPWRVCHRRRTMGRPRTWREEKRKFYSFSRQPSMGSRHRSSKCNCRTKCAESVWAFRLSRLRFAQPAKPRDNLSQRARLGTKCDLARGWPEGGGGAAPAMGHHDVSRKKQLLPDGRGFRWVVDKLSLIHI